MPASAPAETGAIVMWLTQIESDEIEGTPRPF